VAGDAYEHRPGKIRTVHLQVSGTDHLAGRACPGAIAGRDRAEPADHLGRLQAVKFELGAADHGGVAIDLVQPLIAFDSAERGNGPAIVAGLDLARRPGEEGRGAIAFDAAAGQRVDLRPGRGGASCPAAQLADRSDQALARRLARLRLMARPPEPAADPGEDRHHAADDPPAVAREEVADLLPAELVIHFFQESLTVVRAERHSKSPFGEPAQGQGRPSTYLSGPQRSPRGRAPRNSLARARGKRNTTSCPGRSALRWGRR